MSASMLVASRAKSQHVSINTRCPFTRYGSNAVRELPYDFMSKVPARSVPSLRKGVTRFSPSLAEPHHVGQTNAMGAPSAPTTHPILAVKLSGAKAAIYAHRSNTAFASDDG